MELVLRQGKDELCIDHSDGSVGFVVLNPDGLQIDFSVETEEWEQLKDFIDNSIREYERNKKKL